MNSHDHDESGLGGARAAKKRIMIVDDHPLVSKGLASLLRTTADLEVCAESGTAWEALKVLEKETFDLMILDMSLPGTSGLDFLKDLRIRYPDLPVLVLSMYEENIYAERVLRAGAKGYVMKQAPGAKVIEAIRCVLADGIYVNPILTSRMLELFVVDKSCANPRVGLELLNDRELQVYTFIGNGLSTKEIASQLNLSAKTVQTYREHIKSKLGLSHAAELAHAATQWVRNGNGV